jgi:hypothetical protein
VSHTTNHLPNYCFKSYPLISIIDYSNSNQIVNEYINKQSSNYKSSSYPLINDVGIYEYTNSNKCIDNTGISKDFTTIKSISNYHKNPLFLHQKNKIKINSKIVYHLNNIISRKLLKDIHTDINVAIELCLLFVSELTSTYFEILDGSNPKGWRALKAEYLRDFLSVDPLAYKKVREALEFPLKTGPILVCDYVFIEGKKSFHYRLGDAYVGRGIITYELRTSVAKQILNRRFLRSYGVAVSNPICKNLLELYPTITLPTKEQILDEAKKLIKQDFKTKKGKRLTFLNKHSRSYFKNLKELSFVEDAIDIFKYLTDNGLLIPVEGSPESGGRVVDSFTLMPSWIRRLVKINGKRFIEADYSCLHPNIAMKLYGGKMEYITHYEVAKGAGLNADTVKSEHLSFFNKMIWQMKKSPLYQYYMSNEPLMMKKIIYEKSISVYTHKVTSMNMFKAEVDIMTDVITQLNKMGIYVGYVYDALFCHPDNAEQVKYVMDNTILNHGVKTRCKMSNEEVKEANKEPLNQTKSMNNTKVDSSTPIRITPNDVTHSNYVKDCVLELHKDGRELNVVESIICFDDGTEFNEKVIRVDDMYNPSKKYMLYRYIFN